MSARTDYDDEESVSSILMAGLAVESGVNEYASAWLSKMFGKDQSEAMQFLEKSMDFRKTVECLGFVGAFKRQLRSDLHTVYDSRNKYVHMQTLKILDQLGEQVVKVRRSDDGKLLRTVKVKDDKMSAMVGVTHYRMG